MLGNGKLGFGIGIQAAVAIQVVGGDVGQNGHVGLEAGAVLELVARNLQYINVSVGLEQQPARTNADVPAHLHVGSGLPQDVAKPSRGGGLSVASGNCSYFGIARAVAVKPFYVGP